MKYLPLLWANLWRKPLRLLFTLLSVFIAFVLFGILGATREAFVGGAELVGDERLITMHRVSLIQPLPLSYWRRIESVPGVARVGHASWMEGYYRERSNVIPMMAIDPHYVDLYPEVVIPPEQLEAWHRNRIGAIVGADLVQQFGWQVGDRITMQSAIFQREGGGNGWELVVEGVYESTSRAFAANTVFLHWQYLDEGRTWGDGMVGWYLIEVDDAEHAADVATAVDDLFRNSPAETRTSAEKAFMQGFISQIGDIGTIVVGIAGAVFFSMLLVTANAMAQGVRERTGELAVLKALGFSDRGVLFLVLGESVLVTVLGGAFGLALSWLVAMKLAAGPLALFLPAFYVTPTLLAVGAVLAVGLGVLAGLWPGIQALRLQVATALRRG